MVLKGQRFTGTRSAIEFRHTTITAAKPTKGFSQLGAKAAPPEVDVQINERMILRSLLCPEAHELGVSVEQEVVTVSDRLWNVGDDGGI